MTLTAGNLVLDSTPDPFYDGNQQPSLDLRFAESKTLNDYVSATPLVDHQRSMSGSNLSPGTFVNSSGLIETAKFNLFTESVPTAANLSYPAQQTVTDNYGISPDGFKTSAYITSSSAGYVRTFANVTAGITYTFSFYIKLHTLYNFVYTSRVTSSNLGSLNVDHSSELIAGEWVRLSNTFTATNTELVDFRPFASTKVDAEFWGFQVEEGTTATTYIPTTNLPSAAPRFDHDPTTGESLGLLIEESRTNLALRSEEFDNPTWQRNNSTITANTVTAPNGTQTADTIEMLAVGVNDGVYQAISVANGTYTYSFWARADSNKTIKARIYSSVFEVSFNLTSTWQRFSVTESLTVSNAYPLIKGLTVGDQFYIWGAQLELGSFPTSYIPTTGTALTRSADVASISGSNFGSWYNQSEGTFFTNLGSQGLGLPTRIQAIETGTNNRIQLRDGQSYCFNATQQFYLFYSSALKEAFAFSGSSTSIANSGIIVATAGTANLPNCSKLELGSRSNLDYLNGTIFRLTYYPYRLANTRLQSLTA